MHPQAVKRLRPDANIWVASLILMAFLFSACGGKGEPTFRSLMEEQQVAYSELALALDQIIAKGPTPESDAKVMKLATEIKGLKDRLLTVEPPSQEEMTAYLTTDESNKYVEKVREVSQRFFEIKSKGKGSNSLDRAIEEIANSH